MRFLPSRLIHGSDKSYRVYTRWHNDLHQTDSHYLYALPGLSQTDSSTETTLLPSSFEMRRFSYRTR